jgi:hypothetical protein
VVCSRRLGVARVKGENESHPLLLVAGDTYTCAVTSHFVECWGKSRDGFFKAPGPARIPRLRLSINALSAGPRGLCGEAYDGSARCVGAIPAPPRGGAGVAVSQGDDASACGADAEGIVCWGEAYSPRGRLGAPVRIRVDQVLDPEAPVLDSSGRWDSDCQIQHPCTRERAKLPRCEGAPEAVPWSTIAPLAAAQRGKLVRVKGNFVVGPGRMSAVGCGRLGDGPPNAPRSCCNGGWAPLGLESDGYALRLEGMAPGPCSTLACRACRAAEASVASVLHRAPRQRARVSCSRLRSRTSRRKP